VSLISVSCNVMESAVKDAIIDHVENSDGSARSTDASLLDDGYGVDLVYLTISRHLIRFLARDLVSTSCLRITSVKCERNSSNQLNKLVVNRVVKTVHFLYPVNLSRKRPVNQRTVTYLLARRFCTSDSLSC